MSIAPPIKGSEFRCSYSAHNAPKGQESPRYRQGTNPENGWDWATCQKCADDLRKYGSN